LERSRGDILRGGTDRDCGGAVDRIVGIRVLDTSFVSGPLAYRIAAPALSIHLSIYSSDNHGLRRRIGIEKPCLPTPQHAVDATRRVSEPCQGEGRGFESRRPLQECVSVAGVQDESLSCTGVS
jgi:hypothetical protein